MCRLLLQQIERDFNFNRSTGDCRFITQEKKAEKEVGRVIWGELFPKFTRPYDYTREPNPMGMQKEVGQDS